MTTEPEVVVQVNYDLSVEAAVRLGRYDRVKSDIKSRNFSTKCSGLAEVAVGLIHLNRISSIYDVRDEISRMGYCPIGLYELLALGEHYPNLQREFPIVALASVWRVPGGCHVREVPYLAGDSSDRSLGLRNLEASWPEFFRFAAIRK
ncbi:MAG: hypothetical protein AAB407_00160 [Patescibacteria group bacterium]